MHALWCISLCIMRNKIRAHVMLTLSPSNLICLCIDMLRHNYYDSLQIILTILNLRTWRLTLVMPTLNLNETTSTGQDDQIRFHLQATPTNRNIRLSPIRQVYMINTRLITKTSLCVLCDIL